MTRPRPRTRQKPEPIINARPMSLGRYAALLAARNAGRAVAAAEQLEGRQIVGLCLMIAVVPTFVALIWTFLSTLLSILLFGALAYVGWRLFRSPSADDRILNEYSRYPPRSVHGHPQKRRPADKSSRRSF